MRGIEEAARTWSARALAPSGGEGGGGGHDGSRSGGGGRPMKSDNLDPVSMWLLPDAGEQRVGGPSGRGPLLRRLQTAVPGEVRYLHVTSWQSGKLVCFCTLSLVLFLPPVG